ncbi:SusC/RagA family TonB-linked outer membrane protein [Foetidibacter luteolus]|uniref:SusC/RagA family TonB-linked outer membrane protein n=1 Tax=Foetidibacter luteolus TaxID=2608880 RepID=UPI001A988D3F|nr:SusC/RagA family TonB-linked outer membrane protein [Foetidibacter luteolus]
MLVKPLLKAFMLLCLLFTTQAVLAQTKTVTGKVTDDKGGAVAGASVVVKGTSSGTSTDASGAFRLNVPSSATTLVISYVGFTTQEVAIPSSNDVSVSLAPESAALTDVVVIGYGNVRKKDVTGSVVSVGAKDFNQGTTTSPQQLIQGKVAGLEVTNASGQPGAATTIRIRGNSTVRSGNNPLYVVDGIPLDGRIARPGVNVSGLGVSPATDPLYMFNSNDINNISILKDASATAIYGSRAANGVVLIETKKAASGEPKLDISTSWGLSSIMKRYEVLDGNEYRAALKAKNVTSGDYGGNVDALDAILRNALTQNYNVAMSGGNENGKYRASLGYFDQDGIVKTSNLKRYTANLNGQFKFLPSKKLSLNFNVLVSQNRETIPAISNNAGASGNLISAALQWNPTLSLRRANGTLWSQDNPTGATNPSPVTLLEYYKDRVNVSSVLAYAQVGYKFTDWLEFKSQYSVNHQNGERKAMASDSLNFPEIIGKGIAYVNNAVLSTQVITNTLNFDKDLSSSIRLNAILGYEYQSFTWRGSSITGLGFSTSPLVDYTDILQNVTSGNITVGSYNDPKAYLQSYFGRAIVSFQDRYVLTATLRADGSSKFGSNNKYGTFPSFALAWNINNESFLKDNGVFDELKLRGSWGITGNQEFPAGAAVTQYSYGQGSIAQANVANPDLKWEETKQWNVGLDFVVGKGKLRGTLDYFNKRTSNLLFNFDAIQPAPATKYWTNLPGRILNNGFEIALSSDLVRNKNTTWTVSINGAFLKNVVKDYNGPTVLTGAVSGQGVSGAFVQKLASDQPLNAFYTRKFTGFDKDGFSTYEDGGNTLYFVGNPNPKFLGGFSTTVDYKKFSFGLNINSAMGHVIYNNTLNSVLNISNLGTRNIAKSLVNTDESLANALAPSSRFLEKGDYLKISNLTVRYRLGNVGNVIKNLNISLTGQNLLYITGFTGFSPEVNTDKSSDGVLSYGMEYIPYPTARTFMLGLNFSL